VTSAITWTGLADADREALHALCRGQLYVLTPAGRRLLRGGEGR
jgi:hypothetical protein